MRAGSPRRCCCPAWTVRCGSRCAPGSSGLGLTPDVIASSLHAVAGTADSDGAVTVALHPGERLNRDVVLRFGVAADVTAAIAVRYPGRGRPDGRDLAGHGRAAGAGGDAARGRDVVVVLDRSGSMGGWKMVAARRAAARVIDSLGARDRFAVLAFDNSVTERPPGFTSLAPATDRVPLGGRRVAGPAGGPWRHRDARPGACGGNPAGRRWFS